MPFRSKILLIATCAVMVPFLGLQMAPASAQTQRNLILFVPDGLRALSVSPQNAPAMAAVRDQGVNFANPHSLFPTFTMANASGMATGHFLGDTGVFSNTIYTAFPIKSAGGSVTPFIENDPVMGAVNIADTGLQQGQGMHGSFSRGDTMNFMAAAGPDFKSGFVNEAPVSNADIGKTIAHVLGLKIPFHGTLQGRVVEEALPGGKAPSVDNWVERSKPGTQGLATVLVGQRVDSTRYFDAAGFPGRTVGMDERKAASR